MSSVTEIPVGLFALPLEIEGVGADGILPPAASTDGARLLIPMWAAPSIEDGKSDLLEIWIREPGATTETRFYSNFFPVPVTIPPFFLLPAQYLQSDGDIVLRYRVTSGDNGNEDTSLPQTFIVRRPVPINLEKPTFPSATLWGYLNCNSTPKLWEELWIGVEAQPGRFEAGDVCVLDWEGFDSLNGIKPIPGTKLQVTKVLTKTQADNGTFFILGSDKYEQYIKPMERDSSALASYTLYRNGIPLGRSKSALVKIDRVIPGSSQTCSPPPRFGGLSSTAVNTEVINDVQSSKTLVPGTCSLPSHDSSFGNNADSSNTHSLMESTTMNMPVDPSVQGSKVASDVGALAEPPKIVDQLPDGRLTYKQLKEDRIVKVQLMDIEDKSEYGGARVELHKVPDASTTPVPFDPLTLVETISKPDGGWDFPVAFDAPTTGLVDRFDLAGNYTPYYFVFLIVDAFDNIDTSSPLEVLVDLTAPYQSQPGRGNGTGPRPPLLTLGGTVPAEINDAWLNDPANARGLDLTIPTGYTKFEPGLDGYKFYISQQTTFALMQGEDEASSGKLAAGGIINVPLDFLRALPEGTYYYSYNLTDLPGNISNNAAITNMFRRVVAPAPVLNVPHIPVTGAGGGTPITLTTVAPAPSKTIMEISYTAASNWLPGDRIIPFIISDKSDGPKALPEQAVPPPGTAGKLEFLVDYDTWASVFGDSNGAEEVQFEYWYELQRTTITQNPTSLSVFGALDLSYAGPEQPNLPELENPNIAPVVVQGAGTPAPAPNTLTPAQSGFDATMTWPLWTEPDRPITGREVVTFYYQGKQVGTPIQVRKEDTQVTTTLPWDTIRTEGNGTGANARKAYITIGYPGSLTVMSQKIPTDVHVTAIVINLPVPQLVISSYRAPTGSTIAERIATSINCPSFNHPVVANGPMPPYQTRRLRIRIRPDSNIPAGATVNLEFEGRTSNAVGAPAIPGTLITRSGPMPASGNLEFFLTEYEQIKIIQLPPVGNSRPATRYARIAYTVNGVTAETTVPVALLNSSLVYCEIERPEVP
ncbi:hypothetical protein PMI36_01544 [Pseudomonas sp. GM79]|uniref:hypothetical protein n=1 Tax=Pseudomonas sp. GM79 TaxID=1144338 RepID=UPI00026F72D6|nr:hypothetical protein [Pseudomonas sp. GM79]EJN25925.1 hypothetical protein PMI36_01544 [Pseudomonas sp. GM79]